MQDDFILVPWLYLYQICITKPIITISDCLYFFIQSKALGEMIGLIWFLEIDKIDRLRNPKYLYLSNNKASPLDGLPLARTTA